jgi:hypothetical protein
MALGLAHDAARLAGPPEALAKSEQALGVVLKKHDDREAREPFFRRGEIPAVEVPQISRARPIPTHLHDPEGRPPERLRIACVEIKVSRRIRGAD